ncbi:MAG TPA: DinB family protein [Pyrinomonadaceae bacterium]|nr:DinB family protein [Pyrinomonadaceae bacterium]
MSAETIIGMWKDVRNGLISEVEKIPEDQFSFRATPETRSIAELIQHIVESQKILVAESCRDEANIRRQSFADHYKEHATGVRDVADKNALLEMLRSSMDDTEKCLRDAAGQWNDPMIGLDGRQSTKGAILTFASSHEMYHRGQLTVYERLLNIEPVLTGRVKKLFAQAGSSD